MDAAVALADSNSYSSSLYGQQSSCVDDNDGNRSNCSSLYEQQHRQTSSNDSISMKYSPSPVNNSFPVPAERKRRVSRLRAIGADQQNHFEIGSDTTQNESQKSVDYLLEMEAGGNVVCDSEDEGKVKTNGLPLNGSCSNLPGVETQSSEVSKPYINLIVDELVDTEESYVKDLGEVVEGYLGVFEELTTSKVSIEDCNLLFSNIRAILEFNRSFLRNLKVNRESPVQVANCFVNQIEGFMVYTEYCTNYPSSVKVWSEITMDKAIASSFDKRKRSLGHSLPLSAYLFKPVQRILKYHLLLHNIVNNHENDVAGHDVLVAALNCMVDIARHINEMKRQHERMLRTYELQEALASSISKDIKLISFGDLNLEDDFRVSGSSGDRHVILFSRALLIAKKLKDGGLQIKANIRLSNLSLVENVPREPCYFSVAPFDSTKRVFMLQAKCLEQKNIWCQEIKKLMIENHPSAIPERAKQVLGISSKDDQEARPRSGSLQAMLALRQQSEQLIKNSDKRRSRRKSADRSIKDTDNGMSSRLPSLYDQMTQSIDDVARDQPQHEMVARKRSTSHTSILNAIRNPLCNGWGGETDAIPPERGRSTERLLSKRNDRRSLSLDSFCLANKDVSSTEVDSDESSSSVEPKSNDDSSVTVFDDCCSIRSGTDSEHTDITDGECRSSGRTNLQSSVCQLNGYRKVVIGNNSGQNVLGHTVKLNSANKCSAVTLGASISTGDREPIRRREAMRENKRESPGLNSNKLNNDVGTSPLKTKLERFETDNRNSLNSANSKLQAANLNFGKKETILIGSNKMVDKVFADTTYVHGSSTEQTSGVTRMMPTILVENPPCDEVSDMVGLLNEDDDTLHADWPENYVFQLARAFSYRAKKTNNNSVPSSRRPKLDKSVFQHQSQTISESEKTGAIATVKTPFIEEHSAVTETKLKKGPPSEWSDRSRSSSFDNDWHLTAVGKQKVRDTVRLFNMQATSRSFDRLNSNLRSLAEPVGIELHAAESDDESSINIRRATSRSMSVGRPTRAPGTLVQERMKVFECRRD